MQGEDGGKGKKDDDDGDGTLVVPNGPTLEGPGSGSASPRLQRPNPKAEVITKGKNRDIPSLGSTDKQGSAIDLDIGPPLDPQQSRNYKTIQQVMKRRFTLK